MEAPTSHGPTIYHHSHVPRGRTKRCDDSLDHTGKKFQRISPRENEIQQWIDDKRVNYKPGDASTDIQRQRLEDIANILGANYCSSHQKANSNRRQPTYKNI